MKYFFTACIILTGSYLFGQEIDNLNGSWVGTITQDEGGYRSDYEFEMYLKQEGDKITGRSYVYVDNIYAEMELVGELHSGFFFRFQEVKMLDFEKFEGMEWCIKKGQLLIKLDKDEWIMDGYWQGNTSFSDCIPGRVKLRRVKPRA